MELFTVINYNILNLISYYHCICNKSIIIILFLFSSCHFRLTSYTFSNILQNKPGMHINNFFNDTIYSFSHHAIYKQQTLLNRKFKHQIITLYFFITTKRQNEEKKVELILNLLYARKINHNNKIYCMLSNKLD